VRIRLVLAVVALMGGSALPLPAQPPTPHEFSFSEPASFLDRFFGPETEQDDAALAGVEVSVADEQRYGAAAAKKFAANLKRRGIRLTAEGKDHEYVRQLVELVRDQMQNRDRYPRLTLSLVESDETDAFAFPGGTLFVFRGMLEFAHNEAALVGVIGHELSHIDRGHQLRDLRRMKLAQQTFSGRGAFSRDRFFERGMRLMRSFMRPFRPADESDADADGATWAFRNGYDPRELAALFARLAERDGDRNNRTPAFFRTHPYHADRYAAIMTLSDELQAAEPHDDLYKGSENLRRRVTRAQREFPE